MSTLSVANLVNVTAINLANTLTIANSISVGNSSVNTVITGSNVFIGTNTFTIGTGTYFASNGNVGIGYSSPTKKLSVNGSLFLSGDFYLGSNVSIGSDGRTLSMGDGGETVSVDGAAGGFTYLVRESTGRIQLSARGGGTINRINLYGNTVAIGPQTSPTMYAVANGNVGIGTTAPSQKLEILSSAAGSSNGVIKLYGYNGSDRYAGIDFHGVTSESYNKIAQITAQVTNGGNGTGAAIGGDLIFRINSTASDVPPERMRLRGSDGNLGIGNSSAVGYGKLGVLSGACYFGVAPDVYTSATFGPRSADDGYCSVLYQHNGFGTGNFWKTDTSSGGLHIVQSVSSTQTSKMWISSNGNIGVGTTSPGQRFTVLDSLSITNSAGAQYLIMGNQDSGGVNRPGVITSWNGGNFQFGYGTSWNGTGGTFTSNMIITYDGRVGINTTDPLKKLHVVGDAIVGPLRTWSLGQPSVSGITTSGANCYTIRFNLAGNAIYYQGMTWEVFMQGGKDWGGHGYTTYYGKMMVTFSAQSTARVHLIQEFSRSYIDNTGAEINYNTYSVSTDSNYMYVTINYKGPSPSDGFRPAMTVVTQEINNYVNSVYAV